MAAATAPRSLLLPWALLLLLAALLHGAASPAAPEKEVPSRPLRLRGRSPLSTPDKSPVRWRLPHPSGARSPRRYPPYLRRYGESSRKMSYKPLPKEGRNHEIKPSEDDELEEAKDITVRVMSSQSVLVTWTDPIYEKQRKTITSRQYMVRYREKGESARWDYKKSSNRRILVDKLIPDTMYEFTVQISEGEKEGKWSASVYQRTPEAAPTAAPENLNVWPIDGKTPSVAATWDALSESEGKVKEYILSYAPALKPFGAKSISYPGETTSALVEGLQSGERYIFKIRAANRRGQGPQSKAFAVILPADNVDELTVDQQTNARDSEPQPSSSSQDLSSKSSISDLKNKLLAGNRNPAKKQLSSRKDIQPKGDSLFTRDTVGHHALKEIATAQPETQDIKSSVKSHSLNKPSHTVDSSGKTSLRTPTPVKSGQINAGKQRLLSPSSSSSPSIPKYKENETKNLRLDSSNNPSSLEVTLDNLPVDSESNDKVDSTEGKHISYSNQQHSVHRKVAQSHPPKLLPPSVSVKSPTSVAASNSNHPSYKLVPADTSDPSKRSNGRDVLKKEQKPSTRPQGGLFPSVQARPLPHSGSQAVRESRVATSAVSAAATHILPHSYHPSSTKHRLSGREDSDDNDNGNNKKEEGKVNKHDLSLSRSSSRASVGQTASERFDILKYRSAVITNHFANRASNTRDRRVQSSKDSSAMESSKVHPHSSSHLTTDRSDSDNNNGKNLQDEDETPLPSTVSHNYSPSFPKSSVEYSRRTSPQVGSKSHHRDMTIENSKPTNTQEETHGEEKDATNTKSLHKIQHSSGQFPSQSRHQLTNSQSSRSRETSPPTRSVSRTSVEKSPPLRSPASKQSSPLSKMTLMGGSHALSRKTSNYSHSKPFLNSRTQPTLMIPLQSNEDMEDEDEGNLEENYYKEPSEKEQKNSYPVPDKEAPIPRRASPALYGESPSAFPKHSDSRTHKFGRKSPTQHEPLTSSRRLTLSPRQRTSSEDMFDIYKLPSSSHQSRHIEPESIFPEDTVKDHQHNRETGLFSKPSSTSHRQTHPSLSRYPAVSRIPPVSSSISGDSKNLYNNVAREKNTSPSTVLSHKETFVDEEKYKEEEEAEDKEEKYTSSKTSNTAPLGKPLLTSRSSQLHSASPTRSLTSPSLVSNQRVQNSRLFNLSQRQQPRLPRRQGNGGRPNLTSKPEQNNKISPDNNGKRHGQKVINGPQGTKWIVDLDRGLVLNIEGRYLQNSEGKPLRVKLGGDGRTIVDSNGAPVVSPEGLPLFGHGRFSKPVANAQDKPIISLGGKPLIGLEMIKRTTTPSTTITTTTTTTATTTTTTTPEPTTTEPPTEKPLPTCPPGSYPEYDEEGNIVLGSNGHPECNSEDLVLSNKRGIRKPLCSRGEDGQNELDNNLEDAPEFQQGKLNKASFGFPVSRNVLDTFSGLDEDVAGTTESYAIYDEDYEFSDTTLPPPTTTTIATTLKELPETTFPEFSVAGTDPLSEYDAAGKKRFTAPYVTYLNKDPGAPCSLTEALDHFQVESLDEIIPNVLKNKEMRPPNVPHNITIVAVEGCHSFVILDWAKPLQGDLVTGYLVYSASYDDFIRNRWSTKTAGSTNLPIENLKPNTRYYFKIQAKNPYGYGPVSSSMSYVTESDNPLLIVRPPGGEPIWIPFSFKYDPTYSECGGKQYVKRTWYRKFVGVVLCNSLRYKIYLSDDLRDTFYSIGDSWGRGEDHCQFVDSHLDGRTGPQTYVEALPPIQGYYRHYRQEPVSFGRIGYMTPYYYAGWYECGVPIPGKW